MHSHRGGGAPHHHHDHGPGRGHDHHHHHHHSASPQGWRFGLAMVVNLGFVAVEVVYGLVANSTALLADAGHNVSDVLGLALAGGAVWLAGLAGAARRTYGFGKATILAALANTLLLLFACGAIAWEAVWRFAAAEPVDPAPMMWVAALGVAVNAGSAMLFVSRGESDVNVRGAFLHLAADALVSLGVIAAGAAIAVTGLAWIDPAVSLVIVVVIGAGAWSLLKESLDLAMDATPAGLDIEAVRGLLENLPGVAEVHDLHVWNISAQDTALTAHLVRAEGPEPRFMHAARTALRERFGLEHVTLQVEAAPCEEREHLHP